MKFQPCVSGRGEVALGIGPGKDGPCLHRLGWARPQVSHGELRPEALPRPFPPKLSHAPTARVALGKGSGERGPPASKIFPKARSRAFFRD